jgi:hypothetical protein
MRDAANVGTGPRQESRSNGCRFAQSNFCLFDKASGLGQFYAELIYS